MAQRPQDGPVLVFATDPDPSYEQALEALGVNVATASSLDEALRILRARGVHSLLVEGGASLAASLLEAELVDRLVLFQAPVLLGAGAVPAFAGLSGSAGPLRWRRLHSEWIGVDHMVVLAPER